MSAAHLPGEESREIMSGILEYDDPAALTFDVLTRIGAFEIQAVKVRRLGSGLVHAVKYLDREMQQQLAFCILQQEEAGGWRCDRLTLALPYPLAPDNDELPRFVLVAAGYFPSLVIGGYIARPHDSVGQVRMIRLINAEGELVAEDSVEDELVIFTRKQASLGHTRVELRGTEGELLADSSFADALRNRTSFRPAGVWAWPDPQQAVRQFLSSLSDSVREQNLARTESIQIIKELGNPDHCCYAVRYEDLQGQTRTCFCVVTCCDSGLWLVIVACWDRYFTHQVEKREQKQPWLPLWYVQADPQSLHGRALMAGLVVDNGFEVTRVRLIDGKELALEDTVDDGLVLFLSEQPLQRPIQAELYDSAGRLVGQHRLY
jgi:hypothetical protein